MMVINSKNEFNISYVRECVCVYHNVSAMNLYKKKYKVTFAFVVRVYTKNTSWRFYFVPVMASSRSAHLYLSHYAPHTVALQDQTRLPS